MGLKPDSVHVRVSPAWGGHLSRRTVTRPLGQPTRRSPPRHAGRGAKEGTGHTPACGLTAADSSSAWPCSRWGLPGVPVTRHAGGLLHHLFTLTSREGEFPGSRYVSVALSAGHPRSVTRHRTLWSPDFPHPQRARHAEAAITRPTQASFASRPHVTREPASVNRDGAVCGDVPVGASCGGAGFGVRWAPGRTRGGAPSLRRQRRVSRAVCRDAPVERLAAGRDSASVGRRVGDGAPPRLYDGRGG